MIGQRHARIAFNGYTASPCCTHFVGVGGGGGILSSHPVQLEFSHQNKSSGQAKLQLENIGDETHFHW